MQRNVTTAELHFLSVARRRPDRPSIAVRRHIAGSVRASHGHRNNLAASPARILRSSIRFGAVLVFRQPGCLKSLGQITIAPGVESWAGPSRAITNAIGLRRAKMLPWLSQHLSAPSVIGHAFGATTIMRATSSSAPNVRLTPRNSSPFKTTSGARRTRSPVEHEPTSSNSPVAAQTTRRPFGAVAPVFPGSTSI